MYDKVEVRGQRSEAKGQSTDHSPKPKSISGEYDKEEAANNERSEEALFDSLVAGLLQLHSIPCVKEGRGMDSISHRIPPSPPPPLLFCLLLLATKCNHSSDGRDGLLCNGSSRRISSLLPH